MRDEVVDVLDRFKGKWLHHVGIARIVWDDVTEEEFVGTCGHKDRLAELIQQRYATSMGAANSQVERLIGKCGY